MFEDIIGSKPRPKFNLKAKLEKNGEMVPEATVEVHKDKDMLSGFITCPGMTVTEYDSFCLHLSTLDDLKIYQHPIPIFVEDKEVGGKFKFMLATTRFTASGTATATP